MRKLFRILPCFLKVWLLQFVCAVSKWRFETIDMWNKMAPEFIQIAVHWGRPISRFRHLISLWFLLVSHVSVRFKLGSIFRPFWVPLLKLCGAKGMPTCYKIDAEIGIESRFRGRPAPQNFLWLVARRCLRVDVDPPSWEGNLPEVWKERKKRRQAEGKKGRRDERKLGRKAMCSTRSSQWVDAFSAIVFRRKISSTCFF